jgi:DNA polymerase
LGYPHRRLFESRKLALLHDLGRYDGITLSLEGVGAVLGLEKQKLTEGKDLIKYFAPTLRSYKILMASVPKQPFHAPDKWDAFKKYNLRYVDTEMGYPAALGEVPGIADSLG